MRLHALSMTAFGPFVDTVEVDFDELAGGGVFLLTGDTGAGKTSVLDGVCFALYGEVPGDRHSARHLRSDHADPQTEPLVVLLLSIGDRTFRFTRSPAWDRPKRRGTGTTRVQAHVVVEEQLSSGWTTLTNRLDEAGQLVSRLLGMTCTQFTQVAMLPQGRFQAFLRATSAERHAVLQRLFRTRRFEEVERWLVDRRATLRRRCQTHHDSTAGVVNRLREAAGVETPDEWDLHDLDPLMDDGGLVTWAGELLQSSTSTTTSLEQSLAAAARRLEVDRAAHDVGRRRAEARARGERARTTLAELARTAEVESALVTAVEGHRRAASVLPAALRAETAAEAAAEAEASALLLLRTVEPLLEIPSAEVRPSHLAAAVTRAGEVRAVAESWLPREAQLQDERAALRALSARVIRLEREISEGADERVRLATARGEILPALTETRNLAAQGASCRNALEKAEAGLAAAEEATLLRARLSEACVLLEEATRRAQDLRDHHLDLRERRISGMAAELAGSLAVGCSCPVCGSADHPSPATASAGVSREEEVAAGKRHEAAAFERQAVQESVTSLQVQVAGAIARSGGRGVTEWQQVHAAAADALERTVEASARLETLESELAAIDERHHDLTAIVASSRAALEARLQQQAEGESRRATLESELSELLATHPGATSVAGLVRLHSETMQCLEEALEALTRHERAAHELTLATAAAQDAAAAAGFASPSDAMSAVLPGGEAAARSSVLDARRAARAAATGVLEEAGVAEALSEPAPDLPALEGALRSSETARDSAHSSHQLSATRLSRLAALGAELDQVLASGAPVRREHALVAGLASLVEGRSADNQLKMRLSAYVLSERLRQVVAAANERLGDMTDQRYSLEQADEKGAGEQRGGLSLRVRDDWNGKHRDPATLSGGETFLVSLALALGLADTVSHEAGGTQLDTLFIDEGFGALDATTLDGVMDTLDSLRDGGRVVGLVSHVAELRNRIPSQLEVRKSRRGSTLCVSVANN